MGVALGVALADGSGLPEGDPVGSGDMLGGWLVGVGAGELVAFALADAKGVGVALCGGAVELHATLTRSASTTVAAA